MLCQRYFWTRWVLCIDITSLWLYFLAVNFNPSQCLLMFFLIVCYRNWHEVCSRWSSYGQNSCLFHAQNIHQKGKQMLSSLSFIVSIKCSNLFSSKHFTDTADIPILGYVSADSRFFAIAGLVYHIFSKIHLYYSLFVMSHWGIKKRLIICLILS